MKGTPACRTCDRCGWPPKEPDQDGCNAVNKEVDILAYFVRGVGSRVLQGALEIRCKEMTPSRDTGRGHVLPHSELDDISVFEYKILYMSGGHRNLPVSQGQISPSWCYKVARKAGGFRNPTRPLHDEGKGGYLCVRRHSQLGSGQTALVLSCGYTNSCQKPKSLDFLPEN